MNQSVEYPMQQVSNPGPEHFGAFPGLTHSLLPRKSCLFESGKGKTLKCNGHGVLQDIGNKCHMQ